jgi:hypothetical protein
MTTRSCLPEILLSVTPTPKPQQKERKIKLHRIPERYRMLVREGKLTRTRERERERNWEPTQK